MKILVACEFSGVVRDAFTRRGHYAVSCDFLSSEQPGLHIQDDVLDHLGDGWDMMLAFPPCTYLCRSGARWWRNRKPEQETAIEFVMKLSQAPIDKWAIENPIGILSTVWRKPDQIIQPWLFGHDETNATCLWLKNLPALTPTKIVPEYLPPLNIESGRKPRVHYCAPGTERWKNRSRFLPGIAEAMAEQWG